MTVYVWDFRAQEYEAKDIQNDWKVPLVCMDMNEVINCASCGRLVAFGDCYTSRRIHTSAGMGYNVCPDCYEEEWAEERRQNGN